MTHIPDNTDMHQDVDWTTRKAQRDQRDKLRGGNQPEKDGEEDHRHFEPKGFASATARRSVRPLHQRHERCELS